MIDYKLAEKLWNEPYKPQKQPEKTMVKRTYTKDFNEEPDQKKFDLPSEKEHLLNVTNVFTSEDNPFKNGLPEDVVSAQLEVVGGEEEGRTLLCRMTLNENDRGFFATRLFLKGIGEEYKGSGLSIDTDRWIGRQAYATVVHNGNYANIGEFNFDKKIEQYKPPVGQVEDPADIAWNE